MDVQRFALGATTLYVVQMPDRRAAGQPQQRWMLQNQVEVALFGGAGTGAVWRALQRLGMQTCPLSLKRSSIPALVSDAEYKELLTLLESTLDISCKGRCRAVSLLAVPVAVAVAKSLGRGTLTCAFLAALQQEQPRIWEIQREQEALAERNEVDLLLEDELEVEEEMEAPLLAELIHTHVAFEETKEEQEAVKVYKLDPVPRLVTEQLSAYKDWRLCPLNYQRGSNAVVDITAEHDCSTVQRQGLTQCPHSPLPSALSTHCQPCIVCATGAALPRLRAARARNGAHSRHLWLCTLRRRRSEVVGANAGARPHVVDAGQLYQFSLQHCCPLVGLGRGH